MSSEYLRIIKRLKRADKELSDFENQSAESRQELYGRIESCYSTYCKMRDASQKTATTNERLEWEIICKRAARILDKYSVSIYF